MLWSRVRLLQPLRPPCGVLPAFFCFLPPRAFGVFRRWPPTFLVGRLGYAADHALLYVTGGAAFVSNETSIPSTGITIGGDDTRVGWTVGAGFDYAFTNNWFTGLE